MLKKHNPEILSRNLRIGEFKRGRAWNVSQYHYETITVKFVNGKQICSNVGDMAYGVSKMTSIERCN